MHTYSVYHRKTLLEIGILEDDPSTCSGQV